MGRNSSAESSFGINVIIYVHQLKQIICVLSANMAIFGRSLKIPAKPCFFFCGKITPWTKAKHYISSVFFLRILASQMMICILLDLFNWFVLPVVNPSGVEWLSHGYAPQHHGWRHMATMARVIYRTIPAFP